jgi:molybdate transport system substrate-binding protein
MTPMTHLLRFALGALLALNTVAAAAQQLTVSAATSLTEALREIGARFEAGRPGVTLRFNFAASGPLLQQIVQGAPVDVFVSADDETVARGIEQKVLDAGSARTIASNTLVLIRPIAGAPELRTPADLTRPEVQRIAIGKPATTPVGRYTRQALAAAGLWEPLQPRFVPTDTVRQVLDYVARGEVEAGFVYRTDAAVMPDKVQVVAVVGGHEPIRYPAVLVSDGRHKALAAEFITFLGTPAAQDVLARRGFAPAVSAR